MQLQDRHKSRVAVLRMQRQLGTALYYDNDRFAREDFVDPLVTAYKADAPSAA